MGEPRGFVLREEDWISPRPEACMPWHLSETGEESGIEISSPEQLLAC